MTIQPISKSERNRYGDYAVRIVCDNAIDSDNETMRQLQKAMPFEAKIAVAAPDNGYGRTAYVLCESATQKRQTHLAVEGESGVAELIDGLRRWVALHAFLYYKLNNPVVSDEAWDRKSHQLVRLQRTHGYEAGSWQNEVFKDFRGNTGYHLLFTDDIKSKAHEMID